MDRLKEIITGFTLMYYLAEYSDAPRRVKDYAKKIRLKDSFYEDCDRFLRHNLARVFPELKGAETTILSGEIHNPPVLSVLKKRKNNFVLVPGYFQKIMKLD